MKKILFVLACLVLTSVGAMAQPKDESFGVGISTGWHQGAHLNYVISQDFHLGVGLGLHIQGEAVDPTIAPHVRYFLGHNGNFHPYAIASVYVSQGGLAGQAYIANTGLLLGAGAAYYPTKDVGVFAQLSAVNLPFDNNDKLTLGLLSPSVGIEWYPW